MDCTMEQGYINGMMEAATLETLETESILYTII